MSKMGDSGYPSVMNASKVSTGIGEEIFKQSLPIPEHKTGWIIGKRGSYIKQLEKKSGASITISDSVSKEYGTTWKYIQISGTGRAVDRVKKLLHIRLERLEGMASPDAAGVDDNVFFPPDDDPSDSAEDEGGNLARTLGAASIGAASLKASSSETQDTPAASGSVNSHVTTSS